jgi:uncharacterized protein YbaP (TraB family)
VGLRALLLACVSPSSPTLSRPAHAAPAYGPAQPASAEAAPANQLEVPGRVPPASKSARVVVRPPFLRVEGGAGASLDLFGTIHLGPPEGWTFSPAVREALREADTIVLEIDLRQATEEEVSTIVANSGIFQPGTELEDRLQPETRALLEAHDAELTVLGFPPGIRKLMKPWFLTLGILESQIEGTGYTAASAADQQVLAALGSRELIGLETFRQQFDFFETLSPELQDLILRDALTRLDDSAHDLEILIAAWSSGDEETLLELSREGVEALPGLEDFYAILFDGRNQSWLSTLERLLEDPARRGERVFVAVGALHLVGPSGLPRLLREAGYRVESIDQTESP